MDQKEIERMRENLHLFVDAYVDAIQKFAEALKPFCERLAEAFEEFKLQIPELIEMHVENKSHIESIRSGWIVKRDTRRISQVLDRRPKIIVRKVI